MGARRKLAPTIFSKAGAIRSTEILILTFSAWRRRDDQIAPKNLS
jgi:hypothetical protein